MALLRKSGRANFRESVDDALHSNLAGRQGENVPEESSKADRRAQRDVDFATRVLESPPWRMGKVMATALLSDVVSTPKPESRALSGSILERIASGDTCAVEECLAQYGGLVWSLANKFLNSPTDAEDAVQEIFVEIWQQAGRFDKTMASEITYITMIARRRLIDRMRRTNTTPETLSMSKETLELSEVQQQDYAELADEAAKAARCLQKLSDQQQKILTLSIHQGIPHGGIAKRLSMPLGTVKSFARRGLLQLRECMQRNAFRAAEGSTS